MSRVALPAFLLVLAPHTDDAELGAGGLIAAAVEAGAAVEVLTFSACASAYPDLPLAAEHEEAMRRLGVARYRLLDLPVRCFADPPVRVRLTAELLRAAATGRAEAVLAPHAADPHPDHRAVREEAARVFGPRSGATLLGYEQPHTGQRFRPLVYVPLALRHLARKWEALHAYASQIALGRPYFEQPAVEALARLRGLQCGARYAEAFDAERVVWSASC